MKNRKPTTPEEVVEAVKKQNVLGLGVGALRNTSSEALRFGFVRGFQTFAALLEARMASSPPTSGSHKAAKALLREAEEVARKWGVKEKAAKLPMAKRKAKAS